ncbi:hypothetical protein ABK040_007561 [Willaertia magna]
MTEETIFNGFDEDYYCSSTTTFHYNNLANSSDNNYNEDDEQLETTTFHINKPFFPKTNNNKNDCFVCGSENCIAFDENYGNVCTLCGAQQDNTMQGTASVFREEIEFDKGANRPSILGRHISKDEGLLGAYLYASSSGDALSMKSQSRIQRQILAKRKALFRITELLNALKVPTRFADEVMFLVSQMAEHSNPLTNKKSKRKKKIDNKEEVHMAEASTANSLNNDLDLTANNKEDNDEDNFDLDDYDPTNSTSGQLGNLLYGSLNEEEEEQEATTTINEEEDGEVEDLSYDEKRSRNMNLIKERMKSTLFSNRENDFNQFKSNNEKQEDKDSPGLTFRYTKEKWLDGIIAGSIYIICRREHLPITLLDLSEVLGTTIFELGKKYKEICSTLNIKVDQLDPEILCDKIVNNFTDRFKDEEEKNNAILRTRRLVRVAIKEWLDTGRRPIGLVGAALKLSMESFKIKTSFEDLAEHLNIGKGSLRDRYNELKELMLNLSKNLPWSHEITNKSLIRHLPFLLDFVEQLRDIHRTKIEPSTEEIQESNNTVVNMAPNNDNENNELPISIEDNSVVEVTKPLIPVELTQSTLNNQGLQTKGKQFKAISDINSKVSHALPPAFVKSHLNRERRKQKVEQAKIRISNSLHGIKEDQNNNNNTLINQRMDQEDLEIERLLLEGVAEQSIINGYQHSDKALTEESIKEINKQEDELTDKDLTERELKSFIRTRAEIQVLKQIRNDLGEDIDSEKSIAEAKKRKQKQAMEEGVQEPNTNNMLPLIKKRKGLQ